MKKKTIVWAHVIGISLLFWFLGVDLVVFTEDCNRCRYGRMVIQARVLSIPIYEKIDEDHTEIERIARDLGVACSHRDIDFERFYMYRFRGLCIPDRSNGSCIWRLSSGESWYTEELATKVRAIGLDNPEIGEEFRNRMLYRKDWDYWRRFMLELRDDKVDRILLSVKSLSDHKLRRIADQIEHVEWLVLDYGQEFGPRQTDENAEIILVLGDRIGLYLVEKIVDEKPSRCLAWGSVGDVAHIVLSMIYHRNWPNSEFQESHELTRENPYVTYHRRFLRSESVEQNRENREKLRDAWREMIEAKREKKR